MILFLQPYEVSRSEYEIHHLFQSLNPHRTHPQRPKNAPGFCQKTKFKLEVREVCSDFLVRAFRIILYYLSHQIPSMETMVLNQICMLTCLKLEFSKIFVYVICFPSFLLSPLFFIQRPSLQITPHDGLPMFIPNISVPGSVHIIRKLLLSQLRERSYQHKHLQYPPFGSTVQNPTSPLPRSIYQPFSVQPYRQLNIKSWTLTNHILHRSQSAGPKKGKRSIAPRKKALVRESGIRKVSFEVFFQVLDPSSFFSRSILCFNI